MDISYSFTDLEKIVRDQLMSRRDKCTIFTFSGPLGVGKTSLVKEFLRQCGIIDVVTSPSFGYVNTYNNKCGERFYHFDLYRLPNVNSFFAAGFADYFATSRDNSTVLCIEWPEVIADFLHQKIFHEKICSYVVSYDPIDQNKRLMMCS